MFKFLSIGFNLILHLIDRLGIQLLVENIFFQNFKGTATLWSSIFTAIEHFLYLGVLKFHFDEAW